MPSNYQKFYPTTYPSLLDPKIGQPSGYVTKDGMWAAVPSNGRKFAIVHNGEVVHFAKNFKSAMTYIERGVKRKWKTWTHLDIIYPKMKKCRDPNLRGCAYNHDCFAELMEIRDHVLKYLDTLKDRNNKPLSKWR